MRNRRKSHGELAPAGSFPLGPFTYDIRKIFGIFNPSSPLSQSHSQNLSVLLSRFGQLSSPSKRTSYETVPSSLWMAFTRILVVLFACNHASNNSLRDHARARAQKSIPLRACYLRTFSPHIKVYECQEIRWAMSYDKTIMFSLGKYVSAESILIVVHIA